MKYFIYALALLASVIASVMILGRPLHTETLSGREITHYLASYETLTVEDQDVTVHLNRYSKYEVEPQQLEGEVRVGNLVVTDEWQNVQIPRGAPGTLVTAIFTEVPTPFVIQSLDGRSLEVILESPTSMEVIVTGEDISKRYAMVAITWCVAAIVIILTWVVSYARKADKKESK